jgi:hypothetical protein
MIDLRDVCAEKRWKFKYDEALKAEKHWTTWSKAPYYVEIMCKYGSIYLWEGNFLVANLEGSPRIGARFKREIQDFEAVQGDCVFKFHVKDLDSVAELLKPRKKREGNPLAFSTQVSSGDSEARKGGKVG